MTRLRRSWLFLRGIFNPWIRVPDVCVFSALWWDIHDYPVSKGGDGMPSHFYQYTCWKCHHLFTI